MSRNLETLQDIKKIDVIETSLSSTSTDITDHASDTTNPHSVTKSQVGLSNVDNTSDLNKPISTATQSALDLKAPLASPTFTGTVSGITKSMVGLGNVDNTTDLNKPISTATQSALDLKANQSTTYTKTEVDTAIANLVDSAPTTLDTLNELAAALGDDANFATTVTNSLASKAPLASPTFTGTATTANLSYTGTLTGGTGVINIGSGQIYKDASGNVGIGTSSPSYKLDVQGSSSGELTQRLLNTDSTGVSQIRIQSTTSTSEIDIRSWGLSSTVTRAGVSAAGLKEIVDNSTSVSNGLMIGTDASKPLYFQIAGTERMRIDSAGNVGIGTSSPNAKLHIASAVSSGAITDVAMYGQNTNSDPSTGQGARIYLSSTNNINRSAAIQALVTSGLNGHSLQFLTQDAGAAPSVRMTIDALGRVGIGTSSPSYTLDVFSSNAGNSIVGKFYGAATYAGIATGDTTTTQPNMILGLGNNQTFFTNGSERMRIDSSGNVGIGVTPRNLYTGNSRKTLEIGNTILSNDSGANGNLQLSTNAYVDAGGTWRYTNSYYASLYESNTGGHMWYKAPSGTAGNPITWNQAMTLANTGNLLLGTTTDDGTNKLQVSGSASISGNVGIGTSSPSSTVGMGKFIQVSHTTAGGFNTKNTTSGIETELYSGTASAYLQTTSNHPLSFGTGNIERMRIDSSGNVGIGVTPSAWSNTNAIELAGRVGLCGAGNASTLSNNAYYNGSWRYKDTGVSSGLYYQLSGAHNWLTAPSGTAGNTITWTTAMSLDASSNLAVTGTVQGTQLKSTIATGTAPLTVTSTTAVTNLNADMLDGNHASAFATQTDLTPTNVSDKHNTSTGYFSLPRGTSIQRPSTPYGGDIRFNTNASVIEYYNGSIWASVGLLDGSSIATAAPTATDLKTALIAFNGSATSGIYWLKPPTSPFAFQAYVDFDTPNGPWVHVGNALGGSSPGELWAYPATWKSRTDNYGTYTDPTLSGNSFNAGAFIYCKGNSIMAKEGGGNTGRGGSVGYTQCSGFSNESWRDVYNAAIGSSWPGTNAYYYRLLSITTKTVPQSSLITGVSWDTPGTYTHFVVYAFDGGGDTMCMLQTASYDGSGATTQTEADCGFGANENGSGAGGSPTNPILTSGVSFDVGSNGTQATGWSGVPFSLWIRN